MKPICVKCQRFFRIKKNGYYFVEGMQKPGHANAEPGVSESEWWQPYKVWVGDLWECQGCGTQAIFGVGLSRVSEHYETDFADRIKRLGADQLQVNDC